jgi:hypothetical protein
MPPAQATPVAASLAAQPAPGALQRAEQASRRARNKAQIRLSFIRRDDPAADAPPLARLLRGGRGGSVRLKLFLSYLWMQTNGTHAVPLAYPSQLWAELLELTPANDAGARRINEAQRWLERHHFITVESNPGHANKVTVLEETGNGAAYTPPGHAARLHKDSDEGLKHLYTQIPHELWTQGYMALLSGPGLAFLLILLDQLSLIPPQFVALTPVWISPRNLADHYAISDDTRGKGMTDLQDLGLITISRQAVNPNDFDIHRIRNAYTLNMDTLKHPARRQQW